MVKLISTGAGHGGRKNGTRYTDPGATGNGYEEAYVARLLNNALIAKTGAKDTTDDGGTSVNANLANITAKINACADGYAISNHLNAFNGQATGVEVLYGSADSKPLAAKISKAIANVLGIPDRGAKDGSWLYLAANSGTGKKVLLIEWCFIDNASDMQKLMANMDKAVQAVADCFDNAVVSKPVPAPTPTKKSVDEIAKEVIAGEWSSGQDRFNRLANAGYNAQQVQNRVNELLGATSKPQLKSIDTVAREVLAGQWGNGADRKARLEKAGYNYNQVQSRVNQLA